MSGTNKRLTPGYISLVMAVASTIFVALAVLPGCSDNAPQNLRVEGLGLIVSQLSDECIADLGAEMMAAATMDIRYTDTYVAFPILANAMRDSVKHAEDMKNAVVGLIYESNHMHLVGVSLDYTVNTGDIAGTELQQLVFDIIPSPFFKHIHGFIPINTKLMMPVDAVPAELGQLIAGSTTVFDQTGFSVEILVHMTFEAQFMDGTPVVSEEYVFPLRICNGCLLKAPPEVDCCQLGGKFAFPCRPGNDEYFDCRACCSMYPPGAIDGNTGDPMCSILPPVE